MRINRNGRLTADERILPTARGDLRIPGHTLGPYAQVVNASELPTDDCVRGRHLSDWSSGAVMVAIQRDREETNKQYRSRVRAIAKRVGRHVEKDTLKTNFRMHNSLCVRMTKPQAVAIASDGTEGVVRLSTGIDICLFQLTG